LRRRWIVDKPVGSENERKQSYAFSQIAGQRTAAKVFYRGDDAVAENRRQFAEQEGMTFLSPLRYFSKK